jgi:hypothetical protein
VQRSGVGELGVHTEGAALRVHACRQMKGATIDRAVSLRVSSCGSTRSRLWHQLAHQVRVEDLGHELLGEAVVQEADILPIKGLLNRLHHR